MALRDVDVVVHAAALKHVPIAEYNPYECIQTNVVGAENLVRASLKCGVQKVIALSTDKAVSPVNLYGASKLAADKIFAAGNNIRGEDPTIFSVVRYGNVVGSRGSVIPFFQKMLREGAKSLPITDERMTRFWLTLDQGIDFVLSSLDLMQGGEIFVPKISSMKIVDLVKILDPKVQTHKVGIRPGEKLHEWLITSDESLNAIECEDRFIILPSFLREDAYGQPYKKLDNQFVYSSETNTEWLSPSGLETMLAS